jgi:hypothetical protein
MYFLGTCGLYSVVTKQVYAICLCKLNVIRKNKNKMLFTYIRISMMFNSSSRNSMSLTVFGFFVFFSLSSLLLLLYKSSLSFFNVFI